MATSLLTFRVTRVIGAVQNAIFRETDAIPRPLTQLQLKRDRRRTCKPPTWFVKRGVDPFWTEKELTKENKQFLTEVVEDRFTPTEKDSPLKTEPFERKQWTNRTYRTGVLAVKLGVIPQWTKSGEKFHTTLLQVLDNHVIRYSPPEEFVKSAGYKSKWSKNLGSVVVGAMSSDPLKFTKEYNNLFAEAGVPPKRKLTRFLVTRDAAIEPGTPLNATHFQVGDYVDVQAKTIGHGFQGVVKRWGFKGGPASHGTTKWHRRPGNIGGGRNKAAVWKGRKLPGHMGMDWRILKGLKIWRINTKYNILYVHGPGLPGPTHCYVRIYDTVLRYRRDAMVGRPPPMPTRYPDDPSADGPLPEDLYDDELFQFIEPTIAFENDTKSKP